MHLLGTFVHICQGTFVNFRKPSHMGKNVPMSKSFREAYLAAKAASGFSAAKIAKGAGVSEEQLKKLAQRETASTNVDDAVKIAVFFGVIVEEFIDGRKVTAPGRIAEISTRLSPEGRALLERVAEAQLVSEENQSQKSPSAD